MAMDGTQVYSTITTALADRGRVIRFAISTVQDRHGTVLDPMGMSLAWYQTNPVVIWSHCGTTDDMPAPRPEDLIGRTVGIEVAPDLITFDVEFAGEDVNPVAERVYRAVKGGFLNAVSMGFGIGATVQRDGVKVHTRTELRELSLVLVGSNPSALAVRSYITTGESHMDKNTIVELLGLDEGADREKAEAACMAYLIKTTDEPEKRAEVVKALDEFWPESAAGEAQPAAESETRAAAEGKDKDKTEDKGEDKVEVRSLATANKYLTAALAEARAAQAQEPVKSEAEKREVAVRVVQDLIQRGRIPVSMREEAIKDEMDGTLTGALKFIPEGVHSIAKGAQERASVGTKVATRSAPPAESKDPLAEKAKAIVDRAISLNSTSGSARNVSATQGKAGNLA